jgi:manganese-dependent inorganic pyrophosphatase
MKPILVTSYINPDLDGIAGAIAYAEFLQKTGKKAVVGIFGEAHGEAKYILDRFGLEYPKQISNTGDFDQIILVDYSFVNRKIIAPEKVIEIIDHRKIHHADKFSNAKKQIELVGAAATLIGERFIKEKINISRESAILLCSAIISNTINFKASITTNRDKKVFELLNKVAKLPKYFWKELFAAKSDFSGEKLKKGIEGDFAEFIIAGKKIGVAQIEMIGAKKLIDERDLEIVQILEKIKAEKKLDFVFQNTIDIGDCKNLIIASDNQTQKLLEEILNIRFHGFSAERKSLILRKQIVPLLKEELEK